MKPKVNSRNRRSLVHASRRNFVGVFDPRVVSSVGGDGGHILRMKTKSNRSISDSFVKRPICDFKRLTTTLLHNQCNRKNGEKSNRDSDDCSALIFVKK